MNRTSDTPRMAWVTLRSRRAPAFWAPLAVVLLVALLLGLFAHSWATNHIRHLQALAESEPQAARVAAEHTLRGLSEFAGVFCVLASSFLARYFQLGLRQGRLPPGGWWSLGAHRAATGTTARQLSRAGLGLSALLALLGIITFFLVNHLVESLFAARHAA